MMAWLAFEDRSLAPVQLLGAAIAVSGLVTFRTRRQEPAGGIWWISAGAVAGALVVVAAALLILVKTGAHAHPDPDFSPSDLTVVLGRMPVWILVGCVGGVGGFLLERVGSGEPQP